MCGDHATSYIVAIISPGSPPHVRGPLAYGYKIRCLLGITPACAGTTPAEVILMLALGDHPRMCGDHIKKRLNRVDRTGSPPHVRGPRSHKKKGEESSGITPACAGTTDTVFNVWQFIRDHPRMCGDHKGLISWPDPHSGSPPHVRGPQH